MSAPATTAAAPPPLAVDARDAARMCGVSVAHWYALIAGGRAPAGIRLGRRRLWAVAELSAWLEAGAPTADRWAVMQGAHDA